MHDVSRSLRTSSVIFARARALAHVIRFRCNLPLPRWTWLVSREDPTATSDIGHTFPRRIPPPRAAGATPPLSAFPRARAPYADDTCAGSSSLDRARRRPSTRDRR